ncbi:MAG: GNAT family N-acetyltransferase [Actinomycetota bacterium]
MKIVERQVPEVFDAPVWRQLLDADSNRSVFATPQWCRLWWETFAQGRQDTLAITFEDPDPVGLAAFTIDETSQGRRLRFLGGDDLTDYQGPLVAGDRYRPQVAEALLEFLVKEFDGWDYFEAKNLPVPFHFSEWLVEAADRKGMAFELELHELTAVMTLDASWEQYLQGLASKKRHELARKLRRFDREAPEAYLRSADSQSLEADVGAFVDFHRASAGEKGEFMSPQRAAFFADVAQRMHAGEMLSLDFLEQDGKIMAATFGFRYDGVLYLYNSAYDHSLRSISPGLVIVAKLIQRSMDEGLRRFDFLRGRERYKYDLGAEPLPLHSILIRK